MSALRGRAHQLRGEAGMTLIEMLVALVMGLVVVGGATTLMISAIRKQPEQQKQAQSISTARYELERMTREIRNGTSVTSATASSVSFVSLMRRTACGGGVPTSSSTPSIQCQVVYSCSTTSCTRTEREVGKTSGGTAATIVTGIEAAEVFCFVPSANADPTECGPAKSGTPPTYIGVTLRVPNPSERGNLTVSDGASLRGATLDF
jgi:prepilin-type N-terminal cleavage/methylation domain-containing protein